MSVHVAFASVRSRSFHQGKTVVWVSGATRPCIAKCYMQKRLDSSLETYLDGVESKQVISLGKPFQVRLYFVQSPNGDIPLGTLEIDTVHGRSAAARKGEKSNMLRTNDDVKTKLWPASRNIRTNRTC